MIWVLLTGTAGFVNSSLVTFAGNRFREIYPYNAETYRVAYGTEVDHGQAKPEMLRLLRKYEPRFRGGR